MDLRTLLGLAPTGTKTETTTNPETPATPAQDKAMPTRQISAATDAYVMPFGLMFQAARSADDAVAALQDACKRCDNGHDPKATLDAIAALYTLNRAMNQLERRVAELRPAAEHLSIAVGSTLPASLNPTIAAAMAGKAS